MMLSMLNNLDKVLRLFKFRFKYLSSRNYILIKTTYYLGDKIKRFPMHASSNPVTKL